MTKNQQYIIDCIQATRAQFVQLTDKLTLHQINTIPPGFNNNIAWNLGHISVSTLILAFKTSAVNPSINIPGISQYAKGTRPLQDIDAAALQALKNDALDTINMVKESIQNNHFTNEMITPYTTQTYGVPMTTVDEIIATIAMHDSLHFGIAKAISNIVSITS